MKVLIFLFVALAITGVIVGQWGLMLFSLLVALVAYNLNKSLTLRNDAFDRNPRAAKVPPDTACLLDRHDTECTTDDPYKLPR